MHGQKSLKPVNIESTGISKPDPIEMIVLDSRHRRRNPRLGEIGRQNAFRESPSPRLGHSRLLGRRGSRGSSSRQNGNVGGQNENGRSVVVPIRPAPVAIEPAPTEAPQENPSQLASELSALLARVQEMEAKMRQ